MLVCCSAGLWVVVESAIIHMQKGLSASAERPFYSCNRVCKPGSVLSDHQSLHRVATMLEHKKRSATCGYMSGKQSAYGVASDRVYMAPLVTKRTVSSYLALPSLPSDARRFISVALSRRSPSADVISYPALRSPDFPHDNTFRQHITRPLGSVTLVLYNKIL